MVIQYDLGYRGYPASAHNGWVKIVWLFREGWMMTGCSFEKIAIATKVAIVFLL
jgi:hypothetical protein